MQTGRLASKISLESLNQLNIVRQLERLLSNTKPFNATSICMCRLIAIEIICNRCLDEHRKAVQLHRQRSCRNYTISFYHHLLQCHYV